VRDALYRNWQQPTLSQTLVTRVTIQVARDGRVLGVQLTTSSGNTAMDESVLESVRPVKQIEPPPAGVPSEIYIDFKLQGLG
jgi:TonB family protein